MNHLIENQQDLSKWVRECSGPMKIAVAFWGHGAIELLGLESRRSSVHVLLELSAGASNPKEVQRLCNLLGAKVRQVDRLHAKCFIATSEVVVGSANASANGLGAEGSEATHWRELGIRSSDSNSVAAARGWFDRLWDQSRAIEPRDIELATIAWKRRQVSRPNFAAAPNLFEAVRKNPSQFSNRAIFVVVSTADLSEAARHQVETWEKEQNQTIYAFEDWPQMPVDAKLVCFTDYEGEGFKWDKPKLCHTGAGKQRSRIKLVQPLSSDSIGLASLGALSNWKPLLERAKKSQRRWLSQGGISVPIDEFFKSYAS